MCFKFTVIETLAQCWSVRSPESVTLAASCHGYSGRHYRQTTALGSCYSPGGSTLQCSVRQHLLYHNLLWFLFSTTQITQQTKELVSSVQEDTLNNWPVMILNNQLCMHQVSKHKVPRVLWENTDVINIPKQRSMSATLKLASGNLSTTHQSTQCRCFTLLKHKHKARLYTFSYHLMHINLHKISNCK